jgi:uncharacterized iron-regulated membrane protein
MNEIRAVGVSGVIRFLVSVGFVGICILALLLWGIPVYNRYQVRANESNQIQVNELKIQQTEQLVQVEKQKAQIRIVDAEGVARSQQIINATLTDRYLQHEAIQAQQQMANSPNHTTIYIPSGNNGIPLVKTVDEQPEVSHGAGK